MQGNTRALSSCSDKLLLCGIMGVLDLLPAYTVAILAMLVYLLVNLEFLRM